MCFRYQALAKAGSSTGVSWGRFLWKPALKYHNSMYVSAVKLLFYFHWVCRHIVPINFVHFAYFLYGSFLSGILAPGVFLILQ